jgi:GGDEF domain-containing protein
MDESWILLDSATGLHREWYFWLRVLDEVNRSARYGGPFALLMLEATVHPGSPHRLLDDAASRVPAVIRSTDLGGIIGAGKVGVLLPHQDVAAADVARRRVMERLERQGPAGVRWDARLLCYPGDGAEISNLLTTGCEPDRSHSQRAQDFGKLA